MNRIAVLIESSTIKGNEDLPGARADVINLTKYLTKATGGAWFTSEIVTLSHPTKKALRTAILNASTYDFSFVSFSGHGYHDKVSDLTTVQLNDTEFASENELNPGTQRCLISIDSCRKVTHRAEMITEATAKMARDFVEPDLLAHRNIFDKALENTETGTIKMFSCDLNQAAQEGSNGGYFTHSIIECGFKWSAAIPRGLRSVMPCNAAFTCAKSKVQQLEPQQNPVMRGGRRYDYFPWAVKA